MKKRNLFMSLAIVYGLFVFGFTFDNKGIHWLWTNNIPVAVVLGIAAIVFGILSLVAKEKLTSENKKMKD